MDDLTSIALIGEAVLLGLYIIALAFVIIAAAISTAISLFGWAAEHGFLGVALYVILWVIAAPVMLVVCLVGGVFRALIWWQEDRDEKRAARERKRSARRAKKRVATHPKPGEPGYLDWANRTGPYADKADIGFFREEEEK